VVIMEDVQAGGTIVWITGLQSEEPGVL